MRIQSYLVCVQVFVSLLYLLFSVLTAAESQASPCAPRDYGHGSVVCVCNSTYCDGFSGLTSDAYPENSVRVFQSTKSGQRFNLNFIPLSKSSVNAQSRSSDIITYDFNKTYQSIKGFGGAITDAASIKIMSMSNKTRDHFIRSHYGLSGIEYNMARVPIASCDYSTREYTYLDKKDDFNLTSFALAKEDILFKIPVLRQILNVSHKPVSFFASPWTAPAWMKTNNNEIGRAWLKGEAGDKYHKTWANYFVRFFEEYDKRGIKFWGVTAQNEPSNGLLTPSDWQSTGFTAKAQRDFIKLDLGPALAQSNYKDLKLMILDDNRAFLPTWADIVLGDAEAAKFISGIGVHWYWNSFAGPKLLADTHDKYPETFILATEACNSDSPKSGLGNWEDGVKYSNDIIDNLNHWATGWVDWNMALDLQGGPNWTNDFDTSPVIINSTADEFYKQPMFYHLGHFSKFMPEGSVRVHLEASKSSFLKFVSVLTPSREKVLVVLNQSAEDIPITVVASPHHFNYTVSFDAIATFVWD